LPTRARQVTHRPGSSILRRLAALTLGPCSACESDFTRGDAALAIGLRLGIPVFVVSTAVGAIIGTRTTYVFE
jgi:hypothetical protein